MGKGGEGSGGSAGEWGRGSCRAAGRQAFELHEICGFGLFEFCAVGALEFLEFWSGKKHRGRTLNPKPSEGETSGDESIGLGMLCFALDLGTSH